jgi:hypothetical protein
MGLVAGTCWYADIFDMLTTRFSYICKHMARMATVMIAVCYGPVIESDAEDGKTFGAFE